MLKIVFLVNGVRFASVSMINFKGENNMEYFDLVYTLVILAFFMIAVIVIMVRKKDEVKFTGLSIGPFTAEITEKKVSVEKIELLSVPIAGCAGELLSPPLRIRLQDSSGNSVKNKKVRIELFNEDGLISSKNYCGKMSKLSDDRGIVEFDDLTLKKTGRVCIYIYADTLESRTEDIDVIPPGLNLDFWNEKVGSPQYEEKFNRALRMSGDNRE